jgi:hypothetical protein
LAGWWDEPELVQAPVVLPMQGEAFWARIAWDDGALLQTGQPVVMDDGSGRANPWAAEPNLELKQ